MAKQLSNNTIEREDGDACQRELCGGKLTTRLNGMMECTQCGFTYNRKYRTGTSERAAVPPVIVPDALVTASAKAHHAMMMEVVDEVTPPGEGEGPVDAEAAWADLSSEMRQKHFEEAKRVLEKWWSEIVAHFASGTASREVLDLASTQAQQSKAAEELRALLTEIAIPSLKYCEDKFGHDDQARLNLEAGIGQ